MRISWIFTLLGAFQLSNAERILYVLPIPSKSHYILNQYLIENLAEKGHEVTVISAYSFSKPVPRITELLIPDSSEKMFSTLRGKNSSVRSFSGRNTDSFAFLSVTSLWVSLWVSLVADILNHPPVKDFLRSNEKYDVVVGEGIWMESLLAGFAYKFKAPVVMISPQMPSAYLDDLAGNPSPPAYIPDVLLGYTDEMTFPQLFLNYLFKLAVTFMLNYSQMPRHNALMREYFGEDSPSVMDILYDNTIFLVNNHFSLGLLRPAVPNMIVIGGYHIRPAKPLPKDLEQLISEVRDGVILFSMGTNLRSVEFPKEKFEGILRAFSRLKQRVLWKFETENPPNLPKNVKISKWLPQSDILAHPNVKLFITHGGLLSTTEAVFRGVPAVVIPVFGDQPTNAKLMEKIGVAVSLEYDDINEVSLYDSIQKVLNDPKYAENAKMRSKMIQDRPLSPIDTAIYWIEYAMRYKGVPHLRSGATKLPWYQLEMLDVKIFILSIVIIVYILVKKLFCCLIRKLIGCKSMEVSTQKKKN